MLAATKKVVTIGMDVDHALPIMEKIGFNCTRETNFNFSYRADTDTVGKTRVTNVDCLKCSVSRTEMLSSEALFIWLVHDTDGTITDFYHDFTLTGL